MAAIDDIISRLTSPYTQEITSNNYKFLSIFADEYDEIDTTISDIKSAHFIDSATGKSLDYIGIFLQTFRETGESDLLYRSRLKTMFARYSSSGTIPDLMSISAAVLSTNTGEIIVVEDFTTLYAHFELWVLFSVLKDSGLSNAEFESILTSVKPAGVSFDFYAYESLSDGMLISGLMYHEFGGVKTGTMDISDAISHVWDAYKSLSDSIKVSAAINPEFDQTETGTTKISETNNMYHYTDVTYTNSLNITA